jgi:hypothetical protein
MPYAKIEDRRAYNAAWEKRNPEKVAASRRKWIEKSGWTPTATNQKSRGEVGSPKREAYNERRRVRRKAAILAELEASRKHRGSLWEFIGRRAA